MHHFSNTVAEALGKAFEKDPHDPARREAIRTALSLARKEIESGGGSAREIMMLLGECIASATQVTRAASAEERARQVQLLIDECVSAYFG